MKKVPKCNCCGYYPKSIKRAKESFMSEDMEIDNE